MAKPRAADPRARLLRWYDSNRRDLPWRNTRDPYAIWVSEVMLQQTRVETVVRYYDRFLSRFPTTHALAAASEDDVLSAWSGLGYYRRGRLLHQGVREVVARYGGEVPIDPEQRLGLPGIGRYTAGAIGSIAFDRPEPIVDGNVARVLCRLGGIETPIGRSETDRRLWHEAAIWAVGSRPGDLNQALMELGATVCTPRSPRCAECPLRAECVALREGRTETLPVARAKKAPKAVGWVALLAGDSNGVWFARGQEALFAGLWNLPMAEGHGRAAAQKLMRASGLRGKLPTRAQTTLEHILSHRRLSVQLWCIPHVEHEGSSLLRRLRVRELGTLGTSRLTLKLIAAGHVADTE